MATAVLTREARGIWRFSRADLLLVVLALGHAAVLATWPSAPLIAVGIWWNSNTVAHNFIHRPFFRSGAWNRAFSAALSALLGIPQRLWRDRHLAHHAEVEWRPCLSRQLVIEAALVAAVWSALLATHPRFFATAYLPGYLAGLGLCWLQGYEEHAKGGPVSHYGWLYNFLCLNDGYHAEHHADPSTHWTELAMRREHGAASSRWPALLRWVDWSPLEALVRMVLCMPRRGLQLRRVGRVAVVGGGPSSRSRAASRELVTHTPPGWLPLLRWVDWSPLEALERAVLVRPRWQRFVLRAHRRAFARLLPRAGRVERVAIVGGGLFPRTALLLRELLPNAHLIVIDGSAANIEMARRWLDDAVEFRCDWYRSSDEFDLTVIPLCLKGDREALYRNARGPLLVHDWIWRRRDRGAVVSWLLLKRLNLVMP